MFVLGIETATIVAGVAVVNEDKVISEEFVNNKLNHSQNLMPMISRVVAAAGITPKELDGIAVSNGPGSFTGLRIGLAAAKSMAQVLELPLVGVPTLDALAYNMRGQSAIVCPILDARKNQVYTAIYRMGASMELITEYLAIPVGELVDRLQQYQGKITLVGDGVPVFGQQIREALPNRVELAPAINCMPRGASVAMLGLKQLQQGAGQEWLYLEPTYVRASEAEVTWAQKQAREGN